MKIDIATELRAANQELQKEPKRIAVGLGICAAIGLVALISLSIAASYASNSRPWIIAASSIGGTFIAIAASGYWALFITKDEFQPLREEAIEKMMDDFNEHSLLLPKI